MKLALLHFQQEPGAKEVKESPQKLTLSALLVSHHYQWACVHIYRVKGISWSSFASFMKSK